MDIRNRVQNERSFSASPTRDMPKLMNYGQWDFLDSSILSNHLYRHAFWEISVGYHSNGKGGYFYQTDSLGHGEIKLNKGHFTLNILNWRHPPRGKIR